VATRREKLERRERAIVEAARSVFLDKGYEKATMAEIAALAGVAQGSTYLYFRNKQAVLSAVLTDFYQRLTAGAREGLRDNSSLESREKLQFLAGHHMRYVLGDWKLMLLSTSLLRDQLDYAQSSAYELNREYTGVFDDVLREGISRGEIREDVPLWLLRDQFFGTLEYMARTMVVREREAEVVAAVEAVVNTMYSGMCLAPRDSTGDPGKVTALLERLEASVVRLEAGG
jgi:TetR/AcrR family fatty acid metabolism transcriptional regulator